MTRFCYLRPCVFKKINSEELWSEAVIGCDENELGVDAVGFEKIKRLIEQDLSDFSLDMILPLGKHTFIKFVGARIAQKI